MSHVTCPKCGSNEHTSGYGLAAGPMGGYTFCDGCDALLEFSPDLQGLDVQTCNKIIDGYNAEMRKVWGNKHTDMQRVTEDQ